MANDKSNISIDSTQTIMLRSPMDDLITIRLINDPAQNCKLRLGHPADYTLLVDGEEAAPNVEN
jgi:hypothetical protein